MMQEIYYQAQGWFVFDSPSTGPLLGFLATGLCEGWHEGGKQCPHPDYPLITLMEAGLSGYTPPPGS